MPDLTPSAPITFSPNTLQQICSCGKGPVAPGKLVCFRCHIQGISFTFHGSARSGKENWNQTAREWKEEHLGERVNDPNIQPVDRGCWT